MFYLTDFARVNNFKILGKYKLCFVLEKIKLNFLNCRTKNVYDNLTVIID
jgi:hypothetical protein